MLNIILPQEQDTQNLFRVISSISQVSDRLSALKMQSPKVKEHSGSRYL